MLQPLRWKNDDALEPILSTFSLEKRLLQGRQGINIFLMKIEKSYLKLFCMLPDMFLCYM